MTINLKNSLLVDVREKGEFVSGHNKNSINIPLSEIQMGKVDKIKNSEKDNIVLVCLSGGRAAMAEMFLKKFGIKKKIINHGGWQNLADIK